MSVLAEPTENVEVVEQVDEVASESLVPEQEESSLIVDTDESSTSTEEETSEILEESHSDETSQDVELSTAEEEASPSDESEAKPLTLNQVIDDNTLIIRGASVANATIELSDGGGNTFLTTTSDSMGYFEFSLSNPFVAGQDLVFVSRNDSELLNKTNEVVEARGLQFDTNVGEQLEVTGVTSPNRLVRLVTDKGAILAEQHTDSEGAFDLKVSIENDRDQSFMLQVLDGDRVARQATTKVTMPTDNETHNIQPAAIMPLALIDLDLLNVRNAVRLDNMPVLDTDDVITGKVVIDENSFEDGILGALGEFLQRILAEILTLISGKNITLTITNGESVTQYVSTLSSLNDLAFSFDVSDATIIPGETELRFSVESVVLNLSLLLPLIEAEVVFEDLVLQAEGNQLSLVSVPEAISFAQTSITEANTLNVPRANSEPLSIQVRDTKSLSDPNHPEWRVMVHATNPLTLYENGEVKDVLDGVMYFNNQQIEGSSNAQIVGYRSDFVQEDGGLNTLSINSQQDFYLNFNPAYDTVEGNYTTTLRWDLVDGY